MAQTVIGIFNNSSEAQKAVQELVSEGISRDRIDISNNNSGSSSSASTSGSTSSSYSSSDNYSTSEHEESGVSRFFKNLFGDDDDDATKYSTVASRAQSIVTVHSQSSDEAERVADILDDNGAVDVDEHAAKYGFTGSGSTGSSYNAGSNLQDADYTGRTTASDSTSRTDFSDSTDTERKIPIIEENLEVGKRQVQTGGVRVRSRIVERPVEESVRLREERVNVERNTVDRPATEADFSNFQEKDIEMVERAEVPVVNKQARVVEEVSLGKEVEERSETVKDTVRKTEVDVENLGKTDVNTNRSRDNDL